MQVFSRKKKEKQLKTDSHSKIVRDTFLNKIFSDAAAEGVL